MARIVQRPAARRDFLTHYIYLAEHAGEDTARRFRQALEATYAEVARMPEMGAPRKVRRGRHADVRIWPISGFGSYLIAYRGDRTTVVIERLIHAGQDYRRVLT